MFLSAVSVLVVAQSSSEIPQGLMNNPVYSSLTPPLDGVGFSTIGPGRFISAKETRYTLYRDVLDEYENYRHPRESIHGSTIL